VKKEEKEVTIKADAKTFSLNDLIETFKSVFSSTYVNISGSAYSDVNKSKQGDEEKMPKEEIEKALAAAVEPLKKEIDDLKTKNETLEKSNQEMQEALKKSKQDNDPTFKVEKKENSIKGIM
jgi:aspartate-semialdehyde dehydrogenase